MTSIGLILNTLILDKNLNVTEVAIGSEILKEELIATIEGKKRITIENAIKLGKFFEIPAEFFFTESALVNHNNIGEKSNSNSGFIGTYNNTEQ
jgi:plasmid maintenance system antidote protein VapI